MKGCLVPFRTMLADAAPWYLPLVVLSTLSWLLALNIEDALESRPWVRRWYRVLPPAMVLGLLVVRTVAILTLDMSHNEVSLHLTASSTMGERWQLLFNGEGAWEGGILALLLFGLFVGHLPSLKDAHPSTKTFVQRRMMVHNGFWALLLMLLLFSSDVHGAMSVIPEAPTQPLPSWSSFGAVLVFTLLLMMAGELLVSSSHQVLNNDTRLLYDRALLKSYFVGAVAWWVMSATGVFEGSWWARPQHHADQHAAMLVLVYCSLMALFHAPLTQTEGRLSHHTKQSTTLAWSLGLMWLTMTLATWVMTEGVDGAGEGWVAFVKGWRWATSAMLIGGLLMLLPTVGFDGAHRPEAWWFRMGILASVAVGPIVEPQAWLLVPGCLLGAGAVLVLPWLMESAELTLSVRVGVGALWLIGSAVVFMVEVGQLALILALGLLMLLNLADRWFPRLRRLESRA